MSNSIRTPKLGRTVNSQRIAQAVDDESWQKFRVGMKGKSTQDKLRILFTYWLSRCRLRQHALEQYNNCDVCIRVHNYITALARGGQLAKGSSLQKAIDMNGALEVIR